LLLLAAGTLHGMVAVWGRGWGAGESVIHHPEIHLWHDAQLGALVGILLLGSLVNLMWQPREEPLLAQFYGLGRLVYLLLLAPFDPGATIFLAVILALPLLCYPAFRSLWNFSMSGPISNWLLGLALLAGACMASDAWQWFRFQSLDPSEHALANH